MGGGLNTYTYVGDNPLKWIDSEGLDINVCFYSDAAGPFGHIGFGVNSSLTKGFYPNDNIFRKGAGQVKDDVQQEQSCKTIKTTDDEDECMLQCQNAWAEQRPNYDLIYNQCTSLVRECLTSCGLESGPYKGPLPRPFYKGL